MNRKQPVTPFGWAIKQRLAELQMDQKTFCTRHGIPPSRLSNLINGTRKATRYRKQVADLLDIHDCCNH
ncbi:helix-turn-helix transcriptional regulator [Paenibacillus sp. PK4536]|uniref:helix-turn-helix domain-containing protein n=1 Tax=Paenibacillus TaxID=44249 RepID=UPI000847B45A|nr:MULTISPECIES: helix-turn-helix transcriptional regulator [Paenibacillus]TKJ92003.1 XRE family transcriptional regulator [Paenibacillus sp. CFBP13512]WIM37264.1 helix-turn-helix transcriptional regulator [Paenibacillus sp. PK4536]